MTAPSAREVRAAAGILRAVLARVESGELVVADQRGKRMVARIESATVALDAASGGVR